MGRAAPALQDARLLPGLRLDQQLPDPELLGQPRGPQGPPALRALPGFRAGCAAPTAPAARRPRARRLTPWRFGLPCFAVRFDLPCFAGRFGLGLNGSSAVMLE